MSRFILLALLLLSLKVANKQIHVSVGVQPDDAGRLSNIINEDSYMIYGNEFITDP